MKIGPKEAEFRNTFVGLDETEQDRLMDMARAFSFAMKTHHNERQSGESGESEANRPAEDNLGSRCMCGSRKRTS
jgi:hypothetical protein